MPWTDYLRNKVTDHIYRTATFAKPAALWHALFTVAPTRSTPGTEVGTGVNYARVNLAPADANYAATQGGGAGASSGNTGQTSNLVGIQYGQPSGAWGIVVAIGVFDAASAGNLLEFELLESPRSIDASSSPPFFAAGDWKHLLP